MNFRNGAYLNDYHLNMLPLQYFPVLASVPKHFTAKNKRMLDMNIASFENDTGNVFTRPDYALPVPNEEASYKSLAKYAKPVMPYEPKQVAAFNRAAEWLERQFGPHMQNSRIKSVQEVIEGLDKTTSPGTPWTKKYVDKRVMINDMGEELISWMDADWERMLDPTYTCVFGNSLKEEIRPMEKILKNSIRTFTSGPIDATINGNRLFEDMNRKFYDSHLRTASTVGFTPMYGGWNRLLRKLLRFKRGFALDESEYDSSIRAHLMWACAQFRWNMLRKEDQTPENLQRLKIYYRNLVNTLILTADGVLVFKTCGNPSGSVNTIVDNTLVLYMLLAYAWIMVCPPEKCNYQDFCNHTAFGLCGDDNTWTASEEALVFYNARSIIPVWKEIGVTTTTDCLDPRPVVELDYLSQNTIEFEGIYIPIPNRSKLLTSLLYTESPDNPSMTLIRACAYMRIGWADKELLSYLRQLCSWLIVQYGDVLDSDPEWQQALHQIPTENHLRYLFTGQDLLTLQTESLSRDARKIIKRDKKNSRLRDFKSNMVRSKNSRRSQGAANRKAPGVVVTIARKNKRQRAGASQVARQVAIVQNRGRRPQRRRRGQGRNLTFANSKLTGAQSGLRSITIPFDLYVAELAGSTSFATTRYPLNPGLSATFTSWLANQAVNWEKYEFLQLIVYFKSAVSEYATNGQKGRVILNGDYDATDPSPTSKVQAENSAPSINGKPCENLQLAFSPKEMRSSYGMHFIRSGMIPSNADLKAYDVGFCNVSTQGCTDTSNIGEIHMRGVLRLHTPVVEEAAPAVPANFSMWNVGTGVAGEQVIDFDETVVAGIPGIVNSSGSFTMPKGNYLVNADVSLLAEADAVTGVISFLKNGIALSPPQKIEWGSYGTSEKQSYHLTGYISCEADDVITTYFALSGGTGTTATLADCCRIAFQAV